MASVVQALVCRAFDGDRSMVFPASTLYVRIVQWCLAIAAWMIPGFIGCITVGCVAWPLTAPCQSGCHRQPLVLACCVSMEAAHAGSFHCSCSRDFKTGSGFPCRCRDSSKSLLGSAQVGLSPAGNDLLTSVGGLIVLALFNQGLSVETSSRVFEELAQHAFAPRKVFRIPFLSSIQRAVLAYLGDSLYPAQNIETPLKAIFGTDKSIMDCSHASTNGTKVGIPVATADERPSSKIFTNYNGANDVQSVASKATARLR